VESTDKRDDVEWYSSSRLCKQKYG